MRVYDETQVRNCTLYLFLRGGSFLGSGRCCLFGSALLLRRGLFRGGCLFEMKNKSMQ